MRKIYFQNGILFYYGNPAGYLQGGTVVLDTFLIRQSWFIISEKKNWQK